MRASNLLFLTLLGLTSACASGPEPEPPAYPYAAPSPAPSYSFHGSSPSHLVGSPGLAVAPYTPQVSVIPANAVALSALRSTPCAPEEVAPGVWVSFDC